MERKKRKIDEFEETEKEFKEHFPVLYREIAEGEINLEEEESRTKLGSKRLRKFQGYMPGVIDFICRCKTEAEALEIIEYMLSKGEITEDYASSLKEHLKDKGLEFFGEHRAPGFYERA